MALNTNITPTVNGVFGANLGNQAQQLMTMNADNGKALRNAFNTALGGYQAYQKINQRNNEKQKKIDASNEEQMNKEIAYVENEIARLKAENENLSKQLSEYDSTGMTPEQSAEIEAKNPLYVNLMNEGGV